jgi:coniferyl-aldehyde dehydrogenase
MTTPKQQFDRLHASANLSMDVRKSRLKKLKKVITDRSQDIIEALNQDYLQRCEQETRVAEIMICINEINHSLKHMEAWAKPRSSGAGIKFLFSKNAIIPQPLGVVGIMAPWNYPFNLAIGPMISAIAAGNKVMLKPSEMTPNTAALMQDICSEVFLDTEVAVSLGDIDVAQQFSDLPFKHLLFTGSTGVGKIIMQAAAKNLTPVTLELGGKSPVIIDDDYNIKKAAKSIVGGKLYNAGQTCIAPDYILVSEHRQQALIEAISAEMGKCYPDILNNKDYTAIINNRHYSRILELAKNSETYQCIWPLGSSKDDEKKICPPLLVVNPAADSAIMNNEIFGPLMPIITVKSTDEALDYINSRANPLTLYLFSNKSSLVKQVISETLSGSVAVNETIVQFAQDGIPFGGVGQSGMGSCHGQNGFNTFSHLKTVYYQSRANFNDFIRAPYTPLKKKVIKLLSKL